MSDMSDLLSLRMLAGQVSEEDRIDAASCWHFSDGGSPVWSPPGPVHAWRRSSYMHTAPLCPKSAQAFGGQTRRNAPEQPGPRGTLPAVHASHHPAARLNHQENRDPVAWKTVNEQHYTVRCSQFGDPPSQGSWTRLCPNHRVAVFSITCSVRDMGNYLLSTY